VDPVAELGTEYVINEPVLSDAGQAAEGRTFDNRFEVVPVARNVGAGPRDRSLDAIFQLVR
jgi:hypothetical protein